MAIDTYTLADLAQELQTITSQCEDPQDVIIRVKPIAERAALDKDWLQPEHYTCDAEQPQHPHRAMLPRRSRSSSTILNGMPSAPMPSSRVTRCLSAMSDALT